MKILQSIYQNKLVAVVRGAKKDNIVPIIGALKKGGINVFEVTAETPDVLNLIKYVRANFDSNEITIGAGTILDAETARSAILSGAQFIISPTTNIETIQMTKRYGVVSIPGALTPTEILKAYEHGADIIKVFPANALGPQYFKDLAGPLSHIPIMPTGGVSIDNIQAFFENGAVAVGLGESLVNMNQTINHTNLHNMTDKAATFKKVILS